ncbi:MAG: hypothetical protein WCK67_10000 [bacterium]
MENNKVVILHNEISDNPTIDELDVLDQVKIVDKSLIQLGYNTQILSFSLAIDKVIEKLKEIKPAFIFNLVESINNDGQLVHIAPSIFDYLRIPYTGCSKESTFLTSNKLITKKMMELYAIRTSEWVTIDDENDNTFIKDEKYIIKAVWEDASIGLEDDNVILPKSKEDLIQQIKIKNQKLNLEFFAERYLHGRDLSIPILAGKLLPTREMQFIDYPEDKVKVLGYKAKWEKETDEYDKTEITFEFKEEDKELLSEVAEMAKKCWDKFNLSGYARIDFRTDENDKPYVLEINPNPCIAEDTAFYLALEEAGITYTDAIKAIIDDIKNVYK